MSDWLKREQVVAALKDAQMAPPYQDRGIMAKDAVKLFRMALAALDAHADHAAEVERLEAERAELVDVLADVITQATWRRESGQFKADDDPEDTWSISVGEHYDSGALSAYAAGLRLLARLGKVRIVSQYGRSVIAVDAALSQPQQKGGSDD